MADIFISYARADRPRAQRLAWALSQHGWSVWWDREIPPGKSFDDVIEEALSAAKCVIVVWSNESVKSEWVKAEASEAFKRRILVPILADEAKIPLEFRRLQAARLIDWDRPQVNPDWDQLGQAVATLVGRPSVTPRRTVPPRRRLDWRLVAAVVVAVIVSTAAAIYLRREAPPSPADVLPLPEASSSPSEPVHASRAVAASSSSVAAQEPMREPVAPDMRPTIPPRMTNPPTEQRTVERVLQPLLASSSISDVGHNSMPKAVAKTEAVVDSAPAAVVNDESNFKVTRTYGVYRDQAGLLSVSSGGLRYRDVTSGKDNFDASCRDVKKVAALNVIADQEQRTVELSLRDGFYRFKTQHTTERDGLMAALSRVCGPL